MYRLLEYDCHLDASWDRRTFDGSPSHSHDVGIPGIGPFADFHCSWSEAVEWTCGVCEERLSSQVSRRHHLVGIGDKSSLPNDAASAFVTDPPYYDAVPYAYLSDFFYVWMRRTLAYATFPSS